MDDEDTEVGPPPKQPDTDRALVSVMLADTDEWDDTDREMFAQGTIDTTPQMFEDTGVLILNAPAQPANSDKLVVTFREPSVVAFRKPTNPSPPITTRASTAGDWPPPPREPAQPAPKRAGFYATVTRPDTKNC